MRVDTFALISILRRLLLVLSDEGYSSHGWRFHEMSRRDEICRRVWKILDGSGTSIEL